MRLEWDPQREIRQLRAEIERTFRHARQQRKAASAVLVPPLDLWAGDEQYELWADLPGVSSEQLEVYVEPGLLTIKAAKVPPETMGQRVRGERTFGRLARAIALPEDAEINDIRARLTEGQLQITIARRAAGGRRRVDVIAD